MFMSINEFSWTLFSRHEIAPRPPGLLLAVLAHSPTGPETEKTTVLGYDRLHIHEERNDIEVPAETSLVLAVLDNFEKEFQIYYHTAPADGLSEQWECCGKKKNLK